MKVCGLTGGVGMGKSAAAEILLARGAPVVDTDDLARQLVQPGEPALTEIQQVFGRQMVDASGQLQREALARTVFSDATARQKLESILHPRIRSRWKQQIEHWRAEQKPLAIVVIPLLFETGAETELDVTICVACSLMTQRQRLTARGWTAGQIEQRIAAQWPIEKKINRSNFAAWTEGGLEILAQQLDRIIPIR